MRSSKVAKNSNPLIQLLSSLQQNDRQNSYLLLIQHSLSFAQRQTAASSVGDDISVYQQAKVLTPSERARLDACGNVWAYELATVYIHQVLWVQTIGGKAPENCHKIIPVVDDPLGWDNDDEKDNETTSSSSNIGNLNDLAQKIITSASPSGIVVFDSITPLLMLHGLHQTILFLHRLLHSSIAFIVPVYREMLTAAEHVLLEDLSNALLVLREGTATLLRHGVREGGNVVRDEVFYEIDEQQNNRLKLLSSSKQPKVEKKEVTAVVKNIDESSILDVVIQQSPSVRERPGKITLKIEEEDDSKKSRNPKTAVSQPQIYLEDDDPEFEDLDEEDPDDDLDI